MKKIILLFILPSIAFSQTWDQASNFIGATSVTKSIVVCTETPDVLF